VIRPSEVHMFTITDPSHQTHTHTAFILILINFIWGCVYVCCDWFVYLMSTLPFSVTRVVWMRSIMRVCVCVFLIFRCSAVMLHLL